MITDLLGFIYPFIQNFLFSQEVYYFRTERPEVILAMFCGCPARDEQNGPNRIYYFRILNSEVISSVTLIACTVSSVA